MQWFGQLATPAQSIVDSSYAQWGAIGILAVILFFVGRYLLKDNKALRQENTDLQNARLQDAKDFANIKAQPTDELVKFVRNLYDGDIKRGN